MGDDRLSDMSNEEDKIKLNCLFTLNQTREIIIIIKKNICDFILLFYFHLFISASKSLLQAKKKK